MRIMRLAFMGIIFLLLTATTNGCRKCMCCGPWVGNILCVKGTDTVGRDFYRGMQEDIRLADSLGFYRNKGYTCNEHISPDTRRGQTCGANNLEQAQEMGYSCTTFSQSTASHADCK